MRFWKYEVVCSWSLITFFEKVLDSNERFCDYGILLFLFGTGLVQYVSLVFRILSARQWPCRHRVLVWSKRSQSLFIFFTLYLLLKVKNEVFLLLLHQVSALCLSLGPRNAKKCPKIWVLYFYKNHKVICINPWYQVIPRDNSLGRIFGVFT